MGSQLQDEAAILARLKDNYGHASTMINKEIEELAKHPQTQHVIWQKQYKENLKKNIDSIIDELHAVNDEDISDYLINQYGQGHVGAMYSLQKQGVPLAFGVNQDAALKAASMTGDGMKLSKKLYKSSTEPMKKEVVSEIGRGFASGMHVNDIARNVENRCKVSYNRAARIARTEGGRVHAVAQFEAMKKAKEAGADVVKQWNAALDSRTRSTHQHLDGQIREIDEPFESESGATALHPHGFGVASEDINCRCAVNERARWALDEGFEKLVEVNAKGKERYELMTFDTNSYDAFKAEYWNFTATELLAPINSGTVVSKGSFTKVKNKIEANWSSGEAKALFDMLHTKPDVIATKKDFSYYNMGKIYLTDYKGVQAFPHEFGHWLDEPSKGQYLSKGLYSALVKDVDDLILKYADEHGSKAAAYKALSKELKANQSHASDTIYGLTEGVVKGKYSHDLAYYTPTKIANEFAAEAFHNSLLDPKDYAQFKKYFPTAMKKYEENIKALCKSKGFAAKSIDDAPGLKMLAEEAVETVDDVAKAVATKADDVASDVIDNASDAVKKYDLGFKTGPVTLDDYDSILKKVKKAKSDHTWFINTGQDPKGTHAKHLKAIEEYIADHQKLPAVKAINDIEPPKYVAPPKPKANKVYSGIWKNDVTLDDYAELKATGAIKKKMSDYKHYLIKQGKPQYQAKIDYLQEFIDDGENYLKGIDPVEEAAKKAAAEKAAKEAAEKAAKEAAEKKAAESVEDLLEKTYDMGFKEGLKKLEDYNDDLAKQIKKKKSNLKHFIANNKGPVEKYKKQLAAIEEFEDDFKKIGGKIPEKAKEVVEVVENKVDAVIDGDEWIEAYFTTKSGKYGKKITVKEVAEDDDLYMELLESVADGDSALNGPYGMDFDEFELYEAEKAFLAKVDAYKTSSTTKTAEKVVEEVVEEKLYDVGFKTGPIKLSDHDDIIKSLKAKKATLKTYVKQGKGDVEKYKKQLAVMDEYLDDYAKMGPTAQKTTQVAPKTTAKVNAKVDLPKGYKSHQAVLDKVDEIKNKEYNPNWDLTAAYDHIGIDEFLSNQYFFEDLYEKNIDLLEVHGETSNYAKHVIKPKLKLLEELLEDTKEFEKLEKYLDDVKQVGIDPLAEELTKKATKKAAKAKGTLEKLKKLEVDLPEGYSSAQEALAKIEELEKKTLTGVWVDSIKIDEVLGKNVQGKLDYYDEKIATGKVGVGFAKAQAYKNKKQALLDFVEEAKEYEKLKPYKDKLKKIIKEEEKLKAEAAAEIAFQKNADDYIEFLKDEGKKDLAKAIKADPHSYAAEINEWLDTQGPFNPAAYEPKRRDKCKLPKSAEKADDKYRSRTGEVWRSLSGQERHGAYRYTHSYCPINEPLRGIQYNTEKKLGVGKWEDCAAYMSASERAAAKRDTIGLTRAIEKCWFDEDARLIRGNGWNGSSALLQIDKSLLQNGSIEQLRAALIGKEVKEEAFTSTGIAAGKGFLSKPVIFDIYAPKGTKMIYAEPFSAYADHKVGLENWDGWKKQDYFGTEQEIIIQRGTIFKVRSVDRKGGKLHVSVDVVGQDLSTYPELM